MRTTPSDMKLPPYMAHDPHAPDIQCCDGRCFAAAGACQLFFNIELLGDRGDLIYEFGNCFSDFRAEVPFRSGGFGPGVSASKWIPHAEHRPTVAS